jgi:hypothetical protein
VISPAPTALSSHCAGSTPGRGTENAVIGPTLPVGVSRPCWAAPSAVRRRSSPTSNTQLVGGSQHPATPVVVTPTTTGT